ncbi:cytochrome d ubiquinol oxidase subunit II [Falsirhodobacter sp. alg1]|uniref:cytochrome d ubiquinol oxidase subunit II n=1 Tax=Falsirhodobacter sp. alg1 TaxID=1472418 RepID=UPI0005EFDF0A|nr:cytochrome d ubiquinol oxidase subunit II [Falsirhodobacter sp. alg1]
MNLPLDYETMRVIWWLLLGSLLIGFAIMGGLDMGVGTLLPFAARTDDERRVLLNLMGPTWEGNQVWLVLGGGAIFAAWPALYAVSFSGFYLAMIAILFALILRPVGFKFRGKITHPVWRAVWDWALFIGGFVPALIFGVAVGNVLLGAPFGLDGTLRPYYEGTFFGLLRPFALLCGLLSVSMLVAHGGGLIAMRTSGPMAERGRMFARMGAGAAALLFIIGGVWVTYALQGYRVTSVQDHMGPSNPLAKTVTRETGAWVANYSAHPWMMIAPVLALAGLLVAWIALGQRRGRIAILSSATAIFGIIATAGLSLFPFLLPSSLIPEASLTVWDASSSHLTLFIMLGATVIFLPLILVYTSWVFWVMRGTVTSDTIARNPNAY